MSKNTERLTPTHWCFMRGLAEHGHLSVGSNPPIRSLFSAGLIEWVGHTGSQVVRLTPAGRAALSQQQGDQP